MARDKQRFVCSDCGADFAQWQGRCSACGAWNTLKSFTPASGGGKRASPAAAPAAGGAGVNKPQPLSAVASQGETRIRTGIGELDRVLGGGLVPGCALLLAGDPGIGKSTLLMGAMAQLARGRKTLYVSGEESLAQIKMRAERMQIGGDGFDVLMETRLENIEQAIIETEPAVLCLDSIQTVASDDLPAAAGTVTQVRECAQRLIAAAKMRGMALFLVGHVTKEGQIAGPRVLEHMVDTVLYFEGERGHSYRILRAVKNRFGAANEIGVFEMRDVGLAEVDNPSELFLSERVQGAAGSVVFAGLEGTRPVLIEIQSLVAPSPLPQPRRTAIGFDVNRLAMLTAVLEKRLGLGLFNHDIFLNVAGGFRVTEPAADLAVAVSLYASLRNMSADRGLVIVGEVGLGGETRAVSHIATRLKEAEKLGFNRCLLPDKSMKNLPSPGAMRLEGVASVEEAIERFDV
ncbi:DNA repair protein RadA [Magnetofaba australis]|uniref:DNA repair protein RadA n=1 Tax=Magnetofaba australis TaxID=1472297 RepID=UPI000A19CF3F|nr:DNA repair protein RadA [Magnetofaba australis]